MQCYKTYAATILIANMLEVMPEVRRKLPYSVIAEWMAQNDIQPEDVFQVEPEAMKALLVHLIEKDYPQFPNAA